MNCHLPPAAPEFLERAGQALCGRPLVLMPDTLRLQEAKNTNMKTSSRDSKGEADGQFWCMLLCGCHAVL